MNLPAPSPEYRPHGEYRGIDWLWLAPFAWIFGIGERFYTVSIFTNTVYMPYGVEYQDVPYLTKVHEDIHFAQARRDGKWTFARRYVLSQRWRTLYEAEAYKGAQGWRDEDICRILKRFYFVRAPEAKVMEWIQSAP